MSEVIHDPSTAPFTVVTWNILLDYTRARAGIVAAQKDRLQSHIATLGNLGIDLDVVCLQEVQGNDRKNNGQRIARGLGYEPGDWYNHNSSKRDGEYIGMFGAKVDGASSIELPHDKLAVVTKVGQTAIVGIHNRREVVGPKRYHQMKSILSVLKDEEHAVIMGDSNDLPRGSSRRPLGFAGFESVFKLVRKDNPITHPTEAYRNAFYNPHLKRTSFKGISMDIIYARNMHVLDVGRFEGDSDHYGLWATVVPKQQD
jgi:endonuclease/exonuclease/phosphatase family metal-dependent hydrolase